MTAVGYGWTEPPREAFVRGDLSRSRSALTIDGVAGESLGFRADVRAGDWYVTLWLETQIATQPIVHVQDNQQTPEWQVFPAPAELEAALPRLYRVFHGVAPVGGAGLQIDLEGAGDDVRLLAISLCRKDGNDSPAQQQLLNELKQFGDLHSTRSLSDAIERAKSLARANPTASFYANWLQRLEMLAQAESMFTARGWEWAGEKMGLGMIDRHRQAVMLLDGFLAPGADEVAPLADRALYLRGRLLYWLGREIGGAEVISNGARELNDLAKRFPDDEILGMYVGKRIDVQDDCDCLQPNTLAPAWSLAQREALCRLRALVRWWTDKRQTSTGELGGKLGDDVELLRWWAPLCLLGDETALTGWRRLADGVWNSDRVHEGYARDVTDVEHAAEYIADTAPLMACYSDDPEYLARLQPSVRLFEHLWTEINRNGHRFFRSAWFSSTDVDTTQPKDRDVEYNTRAVQAVRYLAWRSRDPHVIELLHEWSLAWLDAAMRTDKGKPSGIVPASIRSVDESVNGSGSNWYKANMYWRYYDWEHYAGSLMLDQLLFTFLLTEDEQLLQPMFTTLNLIRSTEKVEREGESPKGSRGWAADQLRKCASFWNVVEQWRYASGDRRFDDLILRYGSPYGRYRVSGDERHLIDGLNLLLEEVRYNMPLKTSEALYTDRVYVPGWESLKAMLTGDGMHNNVSPYFRVSWQETDECFTALVSDTTAESVTIQVYSHAAGKRRVIMRVWQMPAGRYRLCCAPQGLPEDEIQLQIQRSSHEVAITVPARRLFTVTLIRDENHETPLQE